MKWKIKFMFQNTNQDMTGLLVGDFNPSEKNMSEKNMSSSVGMMTFPIYVKIKNVPNHQPIEI